MATDGVSGRGDNVVAELAATQVDDQTENVAAGVDTTGAMQAALASFDGLRVDAAIQVVHLMFRPIVAAV